MESIGYISYSFFLLLDHIWGTNMDKGIDFPVHFWDSAGLIRSTFSPFQWFHLQSDKNIQKSKRGVFST